ncbi:MAG: hypothetical protein NZ959_04565 [Armatimonadetes bacterium]|nr:hypothetical protein [Armatimonadota bacterium]MDW8121837.1 DNA gyrase C-terminal beta-propeller domain-containing protein [Armatimonadota bacterium]
MGRVRRGRDGDRYLLIVSANGQGKRVPISEFKIRTKGTKGSSALPMGSELGGACLVRPADEVLIITRKGIVLRLFVDDVTVFGRSARGGRLIRLDDDDQVVAVVRL